MDKFTASNGIEFQVEGINGPMLWRSPGDPLGTEEWIPIGQSLQGDSVFGFSLRSGLADALREFFVHERDVELGRWRWPGSDTVVVYPGVIPGRARVVSEVTGESEWRSRGQGTQHPTETQMWYHRAAVAYFASHPEPKPWHDAKPGELWSMRYQAVPEERTVFVVDDRIAGVFSDSEGNTWAVNDSRIVSARRIYPEVTDD